MRGEPVDLAELAREAAAADERAEAKGGPALVLGERPALERAVGNLVRNARKHGPAGGPIRVEVESDGEQALLRVADEGPGLSSEEAAHAFERFWRGPGARGEGSGLGLAIVRAIAERHGGRVEVDGACFTLALPAVRDLSRSAPTNQSSPPAPREGPHETTAHHDRE